MTKITDDYLEGYMGNLSCIKNTQKCEEYKCIDGEIYKIKQEFKDKYNNEEIWRMLYKSRNKTKKRVLSHKKVKVLIIIAAVLGTWLASPLGTTGNRSYTFKQLPAISGHGVVLNNNTDNLRFESEEEILNAKIEERLDISPLIFMNRPVGFAYVGYKMSKNKAEVYYKFDGKELILEEGNINDFTNDIDRKKQEIEVINLELINQELSIFRVSEGNVIKYSSEIIMDEAYYIISSNFDLDLFRLLIKDVFIQTK